MVGVLREIPGSGRRRGRARRRLQCRLTLAGRGGRTEGRGWPFSRLVVCLLCLASPGLALPCLTLPHLALPCLALRCRALPYLALLWFALLACLCSCLSRVRRVVCAWTPYRSSVVALRRVALRCVALRFFVLFCFALLCFALLVGFCLLAFVLLACLLCGVWYARGLLVAHRSLCVYVRGVTHNVSPAVGLLRRRQWEETLSSRSSSSNSRGRSSHHISRSNTNHHPSISRGGIRCESNLPSLLRSGFAEGRRRVEEEAMAILSRARIPLGVYLREDCFFSVSTDLWSNHGMASPRDRSNHCATTLYH